MVPTVIIILFVAFLIYKKAKANKAARIAAEQKQHRQLEARERINQMKKEEKEWEKQAQEAHDRYVAETEAAIAANPGSEKIRLSETQNEVTPQLLNITEFTPISKLRYIAFDLETTGLDSTDDSIVEIGAVLIENGIVTKEYQQLINPGRPMPLDATAINHITDDMLAGQPKIHQVLPAFLAFVGDDILAAHNVKFDLRFICQACMRNRFRIPVGFFDTMNLARYWPEAEDKKLISLASAAGIEINNTHRALSDAHAVADLIAATNSRRTESRKKKGT